MTDIDIKEKLNDLVKKIDPKNNSADQDIEEIFSFLSIGLSYILFESDAIKRENRYLRSLLEQKDD